MTRRRASFNYHPGYTSVDIICLTLHEFTGVGKSEDYKPIAKIILNELDAFKKYQQTRRAKLAREE